MSSTHFIHIWFQISDNWKILTFLQELQNFQAKMTNQYLIKTYYPNLKIYYDWQMMKF
jgi:hypothetical protein